MSKIWNKSWFEVDLLGLTRRKSRWSWSFRLKRVSEVNPSRSQKNKKWNFWDRAGGPRNHCTSDLTKSRHRQCTTKRSIMGSKPLWNRILICFHLRFTSFWSFYKFEMSTLHTSSYRPAISVNLWQFYIFWRFKK